MKTKLRKSKSNKQHRRLSVGNSEGAPRADEVGWTVGDEAEREVQKQNIPTLPGPYGSMQQKNCFCFS